MWLCRWDATAVLGGAAQEQLARAAWVMGPPALLRLLLLPTPLLSFQRCRHQLKSFLSAKLWTPLAAIQAPKNLFVVLPHRNQKQIFFLTRCKVSSIFFKSCQLIVFLSFLGQWWARAVLVCLLIRRFGPSLLKLPPNGLELLLWLFFSLKRKILFHFRLHANSCLESTRVSFQHPEKEAFW